MRKFSHFAAIDWSGAKVERPAGIAVATIDARGPPALLHPTLPWSRGDIMTWLLQLSATQQNILIGIDLSMALPYFDRTAYFPQWTESPQDARRLWQLVDELSADDPFLSVASFLAHPQASRHFRHGKGVVGDLFSGGIGRLRRVERIQRATQHGNSASCFNLVGAAQVGKSSLTGMRMLHHLRGKIAIWPFDPLPAAGPVLVEIYTSIAAQAAGLPRGRSKVREPAALIMPSPSWNLHHRPA